MKSIFKKSTLYAEVYFRMARPLQLVAVTLVYLLGTGIARANNWVFDFPAFSSGYLVVMLISISIHYTNEYADHETDALTTRTPYSGGSGALPETGLRPQVALSGAWVALTIGSALAIAALLLGTINPASLAVLAFGAFFGWMYSVRPLALAWHGWGEVTNAALGGITLPIYAYTVQTGRLDGMILLASLPFGMMVFINLLATTWPDRKADAAVGKHTLATRWQIKRLRMLYIGIAAGAFISMILLEGLIVPSVVTWSSFLAFPVTIWGARAYTQKHSPFPTVAAMTIMLLAQLVSWWMVC